MGRKRAGKHAAPASASGRFLRVLFFSLFLLSGAAGLIYEVAWTRVFGLVFGNTVYAISAVLAIFMGGLALGSYAIGRAVDRWGRPLLFYAGLEIGVGLWALAFPSLMRAIEPLYVWLYQTYHPTPATLTLLRLFLATAVLILPTTLMGGTLPALTKAFVRQLGEVGREAGLLYGVNTFGAVIGCALTGFVLIEHLGVTATLYAVALVSIAVGVIALIFARAIAGEETVGPARGEQSKAPGKKAVAAAESTALTHAALWTVLIGYGVSGFAALAYEVLWTRLLVYMVTTAVHAFTVMLTTFLLGIAVGSVVCSRFWVGKTNRLLFRFALIEVLIAVSALATVPLLAHLPELNKVLNDLLRRATWERVVLKRFLLASAIMLAPTFLMGAAFPIASRLCIGALERLGQGLGRLYAFNTVGSVLGSLAAGFVLLPQLGAERSVLLVASVNLAVGIAVVWQCAVPGLHLRAATGAVGAGALLVAAVAFHPPMFLNLVNGDYYVGSDVVFYKEGASGTVTVHAFGDKDRVLAIDGVGVAGMGIDYRTTQKMQGYIPVGLHPNPRRVLQIGFGSGETARVVRSLGVPEFHVAEICPEIFEAAEHFRDINDGVHDDPSVRKIIADGKNYVRLTDEQYDVIMNDSTYPGSSGSSALYTRDHFVACRARLRDGGFLSSWVPIDLRPEDFAMILRSFQEVFPHTTLWLAANCENKHALLLGSTQPFVVNWARLTRLFEDEKTRADLAGIHITLPHSFLSVYALDPDGVVDFTRGAPLNTDDHPYLEFWANRLRDRPACWQRNLALILKGRRSPEALLQSGDPRQAPARETIESVRRYWQSTQLVFRGQIAGLAGQAGEAVKFHREAQRINHEDPFPRACLAQLEKSAESMEMAVRSIPDDPRAHFMLAQQYYRLGEYEKSEAAYRRVLELEPGNPDAHHNMAQVLVQLKRLDEAEAQFRAAVARRPDYVRAHTNFSWFLLQRGRYAEAEPYARRAVALDPNLDPARFALACILAELGKDREAIEHLETFLRREPNSADAHDRLAQVYEKIGEHDKALAAAEAAVRCAPNNTSFRQRRERLLQAKQPSASNPQQ